MTVPVRGNGGRKKEDGFGRLPSSSLQLYLSMRHAVSILLQSAEKLYYGYVLKKKKDELKVRPSVKNNNLKILFSYNLKLNFSFNIFMKTNSGSINTKRFNMLIVHMNLFTIHLHTMTV